MKRNLLGEIVRVSMIVAVTLAVSNGMLTVGDAKAQVEPQYRVVPIRPPFGEKGAFMYESLLNDMSADGWQFDHSIPGFTVFKRG